MPISVACSGCGKRFKAPDRGAGKSVPCPACKTIISIPKPAANPDEEEDEYRLADVPPPRPPVAAEFHSVIATATPPAAAIRPQPASVAAPPEHVRKPWVPPTNSSTPNWLRHLHWCLALATIPLAISVVFHDESRGELLDRIVETIAAAEQADSSNELATSNTPGGKKPPAAATPNPTEVADESGDPGLSESLSLDDLLYALPGHRLQGALLARDSYLHWLLAAISAAAYLAFLMFLASDKSANPLHLLGIGIFTATGGILLLLVAQMLASIGVIRVGGVIGLVLMILALIGLSYSAALSPDSGLITSFLGFTFGVGLCEEVCKALPILVYYRIGNQQNWRGAFLWGLASGTGFGVAEGIMYSQEYYNGISGLGTYVVRFVSCVALHAIWAGSIGISINQRQDLVQEDHEDWWMHILGVLRLIAVPMVLHGLYDTLLKKDLPFLALITAAASFGYLAWQISRLRQDDDVDERAAYVSQYIRTKAAAETA